LARAGIETNLILDDLRARRDDVLVEADELKPLARLEDLIVYTAKKTDKKGKTNE
jgi:hypothetical protein